MLAKPSAGWCRLTLGDFTASASYLTDIPFEWLRACINGLRYQIPAAFYMDGEGVEYYIVSDMFSTHIITMHNGSALTRLNVGLEDFSRSLVKDIRDYLDNWLWWCDRPLNDEQLARRKAMLLDLLAEAEKCLDSYMKECPENF